MPSKEVGHDTERSLVMPMGVSRSELSGNVRCVTGEQLEALSSSSGRQGSQEGATAVSLKLKWKSRGD